MMETLSDFQAIYTAVMFGIIFCTAYGIYRKVKLVHIQEEEMADTF